MTTIRRFVLVSLFLTAASLSIAPPSQAAASAAGLRAVTLDNLQAAHNGESNARAKYLAFAARADQDGYPSVAALFRAAAEAEAIHAANHAVIIKEMGGTPEATIDTVDVQSTEENLRAAIKGEIYERDTMYPEFIRNAKAANVPAAVRTFMHALAAEASHARLYTENLNGLAKLKGQAAFEYKVCPVCGYTTPKRDLKSCPTCGAPREKFKQVS
jgi:rubrerythrin